MHLQKHATLPTGVCPLMLQYQPFINYLEQTCQFEQAFDKVEHQAMRRIMEHKGFGPKWLQWSNLLRLRFRSDREQLASTILQGAIGCSLS